VNDIRFAFRQLGKSPGFTVVALLTLAIGIGACTAIFSIVNKVLLQPLPYPQPEQLVHISESNPPDFPRFSVAPGNFFDWQRQSTSFSQMAALDGGSVNMTGEGEPIQVNTSRATANYLSTLGVRPLLGRDFYPDEETAGHDGVAILSYGFWQRQFGGRTDIVGRVLRIDGNPVTVVGVTPKDAGARDLTMPAVYSASDKQDHGGHHLFVWGRLKPGVTVSQAGAELAIIAKGLEKQYPDTNKGWHAVVKAALDDTVGSVRPQLFSLLAAVGFLLFIGCANVANLLLVRAAGRSREIAVRSAIGASRTRIVRQLFVEHLVLALLGGVLGTLAAYWGLHILLGLAPARLPRIHEVAVDGRALAFSFGLALLTGVGFGLAPAFQAARVDLNSVLKEAGRGSGDGRRRHRLRNGLVVAELTIAVVLLVGAGLLMRSFIRLTRIQPGFQADSAVVVGLRLPEKKYGEPARQAAFAEQLDERLAAIPGVTSVGATHVLPFVDDYVLAFNIEGSNVAPADAPSANYHVVTPGYFKAMGIPLIRGREFNAGDSANSALVTIVSQSMARRFFPNTDPIGKRMNIQNSPGKWSEIVGVVGDVKEYSLDADTPAENYEPLPQHPYPFQTFVLRTSGSTPGLSAAIRSAVRSVDPDQPIDRVRQLAEIIDGSVASQRFAMNLFMVFSGAALFLATIGIYGVMAYSVSQRTGEIGVRMALGAQSRDVLWMIVRQGALLIAIGIAGGLAGALLLTRFIASMLFGVGAADPLTLAGASLTLALAATAACLVSAVSATRIEPMAALRGN
jgi:putative ABC transport system permease protein